MTQYEQMKAKLARAKQQMEKVEHERKKRKSKSRSVAKRIGLDAVVSPTETGYV